MSIPTVEMSSQQNPFAPHGGTNKMNQSGISNPSQGGFLFGQPSTNNSFQFTGSQTGGQSSTSIPSQGPIFGQPSSSTPANGPFSFTGDQTGMSSQQNPFAPHGGTNPFGRGGSKSNRTMKKVVRKRGGK